MQTFKKKKKKEKTSNQNSSLKLSAFSIILKLCLRKTVYNTVL